VSFGTPYFLLTLLAVPLAAVGYVLLEGRRARRSTAWSREALLPNMVPRRSGRLGHVPAALLLLGLTCLLVGFARPQRFTNVVRSSVATIVLAFDVSGSMAATDVQPSRLAAGRESAIRLLNDLPSRYRVAVVTFGNGVHRVVAPTFDRRQVIAGLPTSVMPRAGTALGEGIGGGVALIVHAAGERIPGSPYRPGAMVVFSDGAQTGGGTTPDEAAGAAFVNGIPVSTIAVGTPHGIVTQSVTVAGFRTSSSISVPVDYGTLQRVSTQTRGTFFRSASGADLTKVYTYLGSPTSRTHVKQSFSAATAGLALVFALSGIGLAGVWFGRVV
jgi:Ca-activated chloride channel family protein